MRSLLGISMLGAAIVALGACSDSTTAVSAPAALSIVSGNAQQGTVGVQLATPLSVLVTKASGAPVQGATVRFQVTTGAASVSPSSVTTDVNGMAATQLTLGSSQGAVQVTATVQGTGLTASFVETAVPFVAAD